MTPATKAIYRWLLSDYIKVSNISADHMLYTEKDLEKSMDKIETINFHQVCVVTYIQIRKRSGCLGKFIVVMFIL